MTTSEKPAFNLDIDIVGTCNLRCPSCPVGNSPELRTRSGLMSRELLKAILDKAVGECTINYVQLFNWTEPFLHPRLPEMVRVVRSRGLPCALSSNLNLTADFDDVLEAHPTSLRVSLSGFHQETYGRTHRQGNIERVKENMRRLSEAKRKIGSPVDLHVLFHRYLGNHGDEASMRQFAERLGFRFDAVWAYLMPLEKNLAFLGEPDSGTTITADDNALIESLALRPDEASRTAIVHRDRPCVLQTERLAVDHEGKVQLCCATFDRKRYTVADFLTTPLVEIQRRRQQHSLCGTCAKHALHVVAVYGAPELEVAALKRVESAFPGLQISPSLTAAAPPTSPSANSQSNPEPFRRPWMVKLLKKAAGWPARFSRKLRKKRAA